MDEHKKMILEKRIAKTMANLEKNNMQPFYAKTKEEALKIVESLIMKGQTVACGGSATLAECGIMDLLRSGRYHFLDRAQPNLSAKESKELLKQAFFADTYLLSTNAVTENGELYNVDGNSNRVAALLYGPDSVIVVAGYNKIVSDLDAAVDRVKKIAAPVNSARLHNETPCTKTGECMDCSSMTGGCRCDARVCCNYVVCAQQRHKNRIKVILVGEELGF